MKLTAILIFCSVTVFGQINYKHHAPRIGDEIIKQQIEYKNPGRSGEQVIWNFGDLKPVNSEYILNYIAAPILGDSLYVLGRDSFLVRNFNVEDLFVGIEHYTMYYYQIKNNSLHILGHENPTTIVHHIEPIPVISYPFNYKQTMDSRYSSDGLYSSREKFQTEGKVHIESDATGKIVLPTRDTLDHVIRVKTIQNIVGLDSVNPLNMQIDTYRWYAEGYRYPVFETIETFNITDSLSESIFTTSFFYPPQEHYYLSDDDANLAVLDSIWNEGNKKPVVDPNKPNLTVNINFSYNFYPNPVKSTLYIEFLLEESGDMTITLYDLQGRVAKTFPKERYLSGMHSKTLDCANLSNGTYILTFNVNGQIVNEKILKK